MKAKLQKISGNPSDKSDSIQFRLEESDMEKYGKEVLALRRYDIVKISANSDLALFFWILKQRIMAMIDLISLSI